MISKRKHKDMSAKIRILYIDDYELDRELVKDALEKEHGGFEEWASLLPNLLNSLYNITLLKIHFLHFLTFSPNLADFGNFSQTNSHTKINDSITTFYNELKQPKLKFLDYNFNL